MDDFIPITKQVPASWKGQVLNNPLNGKSGDSANLSALLEDSEVRITDVVEKPDPCIEIQQEGKQIPIATFGNISLIIGKAKSRKTFLVSLFISTWLKERSLYCLSGNPTIDKSTVLLFDTEQSKFHIHRLVRRCYKLAGIDPNRDLFNFKVYGLRKHSPEERLNLIRHAVYSTREVGLVVIDGINDLLMDINSPFEATSLTSHVMKWSEELDIHVMTVLHANKGDNNARGHLGTELVNKAESVISVARPEDDKNISLVSSEYSRDIPFEPFAFHINDNGLPEILEDYNFPGEVKKMLGKNKN